jgi:hypothetical protein
MITGNLNKRIKVQICFSQTWKTVEKNDKCSLHTLKQDDSVRKSKTHTTTPERGNSMNLESHLKNNQVENA